MKEAAIQAAVISHWKAFGLPNTLVAAVPNAGAFRQPGLKRGLFDLIVMGGPVLRDRTGWLELKTEAGKLGPHQVEFKDFCIAIGVPYAIAVGRDEPIRVLENWGVIKKTGGQP